MKILAEMWETCITSEVEMVEKLQNQEICLTIRPDHASRWTSWKQSRETIAYLKEKQYIQEKVRAKSRPRIQEDQCRQRWVVMRAKAVDALSREWSLKEKIEFFSKLYMEEKDEYFFVKSLRTIPKAASLLL